MKTLIKKLSKNYFLLNVYDLVEVDAFFVEFHVVHEQIFSVLMIVLAAYAGDSVFGDTLWLLSSILIFTFDKFGLGIAVLDEKIDDFILILCFF